MEILHSFYYNNAILTPPHKESGHKRDETGLAWDERPTLRAEKQRFVNATNSQAPVKPAMAVRPSPRARLQK